MVQIWNTIFSPGMFTQSYMLDAWLGSTVVAIIAGWVGFFVVLRGSAFAAHALPKGGFAGAAGAALLGINSIVGLAIFAVAGALGIGWLGKKGHHDVVTALVLVFLLGLGDLFLNLSNLYAPEIFALLFGEILGISAAEVQVTWILGIVILAALVFLYRPLLFSSIAPENAEVQGIPVRKIEIAFLVVLGLATAVTVPIVGALLTFSLMIGPAAAASHLTQRPLQAITLSIVLNLVVVWLSILMSYDTSWPIGFFVATLAALVYGVARLWSHYSQRRSASDANSHLSDNVRIV